MTEDRRAGDDRTIVLAILETVAEIEGIDPLDLHPPLYDAVDPDVIEKLVQAEGFQSLCFRYLGRSVTVESDRQITVE